MRKALPALREAERRDSAELLQVAIRIREMGLEGRRDEEANALRERAPNRGQLAEILQLAMLAPKFAILDETDSGLDADAVRLASESIAERFEGKPELEAHARETVGMTLQSLRMFSQAEEQLRTALDELQALAERHPEPARSAEEEKEQHVASLAFHARLADFAGNPLLGFVIGFMARILTDLTVYRRLYDPPNRALWERVVALSLREFDQIYRRLGSRVTIPASPPVFRSAGGEARPRVESREKPQRPQSAMVSRSESPFVQ